MAAFVLAASAASAQASAGEDAAVFFPAPWSNKSSSARGVTAPVIWNAAVALLAADERAPVGVRRRSLSQSDRNSITSTREQSVEAEKANSKLSAGEKVGATLLFALGGLVAGGAVGAKTCDCDPMQGFRIGAPIGAVAGGVLGYFLASR
jgi:hypothetical protein